MSTNTPRNWQTATLIKSRFAASNVKTLVFSVDTLTPHEPGQHYDIRLTALNGYQAERSYSIASPSDSPSGEKGVLEFGVELLKNGEVSPYLWELKPGEKVEVRGPIGGHFIWNTNMPGPLGLIAGGSGMVPLMSMLRHYSAHAAIDPYREIVFLISARSLDRVLYREELDVFTKRHLNLRLILTLTDTPPPGWSGYARRIDAEMMRAVFGPLLGKMPMLYCCGPTLFVEVAANLLVDMGFNSHEIRTERFGG